MLPNPNYRNKSLDFWANVKLLSQHIGYTDRKTQSIKIPTAEEILTVYDKLRFSKQKIVTHKNDPSRYLNDLLEYFDYRAILLNHTVKNNLMDEIQAKKEFDLLRKKVKSTCPIPMNKQKGKKRAPAFFTGMINMLIEKNLDGEKCDYDPKELTTFSKDSYPEIVMSRRVDGAYPSILNPKAIWEIKEYYYTTTFGSRIADAVYESLLDGYELNQVKQKLNINVKHYLYADAYYTWWELGGKSYLCRIIDMLNMGYVTEVIFGKEIFQRIPIIVKDW